MRAHAEDLHNIVRDTSNSDSATSDVLQSGTVPELSWIAGQMGVRPKPESKQKLIAAIIEKRSGNASASPSSVSPPSGVDLAKAQSVAAGGSGKRVTQDGLPSGHSMWEGKLDYAGRPTWEIRDASGSLAFTLESSETSTPQNVRGNVAYGGFKHSKGFRYVIPESARQGMPFDRWRYVRTGIQAPSRKQAIEEGLRTLEDLRRERGKAEAGSTPAAVSRIPTGRDATPEALQALSSDQLNEGLQKYSAESETGRRYRDESFRRNHQAISKAVLGPRPGSPTAAAVEARLSGKQRITNTWDSDHSGPIAFHGSGSIGRAIDQMGLVEGATEVEGDRLDNVLGRAATDVVQQRISPQAGLERYKAIRDKLPQTSRAREILDSVIVQMDAPRVAPPPMPEGTPAPLRKLMNSLYDVPMVRRDPKEAAKLEELLRDFFAGGRNGTSGLQFITKVGQLRYMRHESTGDEGMLAIVQMVNTAVKELQELRQRDRTALYPPGA